MVDSFRKSSKDNVQVTGAYQPMDDPSGSCASTPGAVARGRKQSVHVYRQDSEKLAGKLAEKLESVVDRPDGETAAAANADPADRNNWILLPADQRQQRQRDEAASPENGLQSAAEPKRKGAVVGRS